MKIIGFIGSPRKNGNTAWTVNKILEGAEIREPKPKFGIPVTLISTHVEAVWDA